MNKVIHRIASLIIALAILLGNHINTQAIGNVYYVSPTGNDANPGTATAPFRTFAKANSVLTAGSTLNIYAGTYNEQLKISKSGTSSAWITVKPVSGTVVIDVNHAATFGLSLAASYVTVSSLEIRNSGDICVNMVGSNLTVDGLIVHECASHGINANNSSQVKILNSRVYHAVLSNVSRSISSGWGSGIKVRVSDNVLIQGNIVYNNYGEGMGTRGTNVTIRANTVYDNFSVNIYTNSENARIERNFVYCTPNSGYERDGLPAIGIGMAEEYFDGWGARLKNAQVINNLVGFCKHGVRYSGADDRLTGGGLKNATIAYNTLYGSTNSALSIVYESAQSGSLIADNIIWQAQDKLTTIDNPAGLTFANNFWKVQPSTAVRSSGDKLGDPKFAVTPGYTPESYRPSSSSPAAASASDIGISNDFFARPRGPSFDIGAIQFTSSSTNPILQATATSIPPTMAPTNTLLPSSPQATATALPSTIQPTNTSLPASPTPTFGVTATPTTLPPTAMFTNTPIQASPTAAILQPTLTSLPPTAISTSIPPTSTSTSAPNPPSPTATLPPIISSNPSTGSGMWITQSELMSLPTSGTAWDKMRSVAYGSWGTADLKDQSNKHAIYTLAGALAYARTGDSSLQSKVRDGILAAKRSLDESSEWQTTNGVLAAGRQLGAYVISADLIDLRNYDASADNEFRSWLTMIRTANIGTHGRWKAITFTCENAAANWGTFACASRIAASIYLGDTADVDRAASILRAFFGERNYYPANAPGRNGYFQPTAAYQSSWACNDATWTGINPACVKSGINIDGVLVDDASRGGGCCVLQGDGIMYSWEALQGLFVSAELLYRTGRYGNPYDWSNQALKRSMDFMQRSGWGISNAATYVPWIANARYGTSYPRAVSYSGRIMSWGNWLYQR